MAAADFAVHGREDDVLMQVRHQSFNVAPVQRVHQGVFHFAQCLVGGLVLRRCGLEGQRADRKAEQK